MKNETLIIATDKGQTNIAKIASMRAQVKREREAANSLLRIEGEVVTMADAVARTGRNARSLRQKYREGQRTWGQLAC